MTEPTQSKRELTRALFRTFFPLLIVIALQQLVTLAVNLADNMMLGKYSEVAMSGAALVNQIHFMLQQLVAGVGAGVAVLGAQYWGKRDTKSIRSIISIGLILSVAAGAVFFAVSMLFPAQLLRLLTPDEAIIAAGVEYLKIMSWTYIIFAISAVLVYSLQSVETAFIGTLMAIGALVTNVSLNYCLIFGNLGFPELGIEGAAIATLAARVIELVIIIIYILFTDKKLQMKLRDFIIFDKSFIKDFIKVSVPVVLSGALWGVAQTVQTGILGHISGDVIAANSIASVVFQLFAVFGMACAAAASVTIGSTIGSGRVERVHHYTRTLQLIFIVIGVLSGVALFLCRNLIVQFYEVSEEIRKLSVSFLVVLSVTTIGTCYEFPVEGGIIAGGGDTKYAAIVDNLFMWLFTIPTAFLSAFVFKFPPVVTFCFLKADQILKCLPNAIRCNRYKWVRDLTKTAK